VREREKEREKERKREGESERERKFLKWKHNSKGCYKGLVRV
jgi:hypothetical protein